MSNIDKLNII